MTSTPSWRRWGSVLLLVVVSACNGSSGSAAPDSNGPDSSAADSNEAVSGTQSTSATEVRAAAAAVEIELGGPQDYFEITATPQLTNIFVATDGGTSAQAYVYLDGELQPPAPPMAGAQGQTFRLDAVDFDDATVLSGVSDGLPTSTIESFSVEGGPNGTVQYVVTVRSDEGGVLDVVVTSSGAVVSVDPI